MAEKKEKRYVSDNAQLMAEWDWERNIELNPAELTMNSHKKAWWKCSKGHTWCAIISSRSKGHGCPYCSRRYAITGENDLQTVNPTLAKEWNYSKNVGLIPENVLPNCNKTVWWICNRGHEWQARISDRNNGKGCPICNSERTTSFPEYALVYYLQKSGLEIIHSYKDLGYELDIYVPSLKIAIEYDGGYWHKDKTNSDIEKNKKCKANGIILYRVREELPPLNDSSIDFVVQKNKVTLSNVIVQIIGRICGRDVDIDLERDYIAIESLREHTEKAKSLLLINPQLAMEWNFEKNGALKPENLAPSSNKKVWWKCAKGHEWQATIASRNSGNGCPYCSGRYAIKGENDLQTINPQLALEWNFEKNGALKPENFTINSGKKVWWKCKQGHEWQATIINRNMGNGCPYCSGHYTITGENDLQTVNPILVNEWNFERNGDLKPENLAPSSNKKVWWKCAKGHEWQATISSRNNGKGCPYCSGRYPIAGENDLQTINPVLAREWLYQKNGDLLPTNVKPNSGKRVWWICNRGHEWQARIQDRNRGRGCPECAKERRKKSK